MSGRLDWHSYHGRLTGDNIDGVADRLRATLDGRRFILVRSSPSSNDGTPQVTTGCVLNSPIQVVVLGDFIAGEGSRVAFEGHAFTISERSPSGHLHHYVFAPEGGDAC
ncbi:hypothetical protein [Nonomuraea wenchangensis]|uniref:Uncharacterized protein n=1 Tax=Nonomuraea wenchangensis TaxID=568860 RepID=A0A1I0LW20_9ACTN|nr:hypothetical protein [Nonomuraea wenchangensis]SEU46338.1 hypothetical protein SAMN05421811_1275 [Nonomuraea wenchangensis]